MEPIMGSIMATLNDPIASLLGKTCFYCLTLKDRLGHSLICHLLLLILHLFNSYRPQHLSVDIMTIQIAPPLPVVTLLVFLVCVQTCLYISTLYFDSQALSLTWFPIQLLSIPSKVPLLPTLLWVISSTTTVQGEHSQHVSRHLPIDPQAEWSKSGKESG